MRLRLAGGESHCRRLYLKKYNQMPLQPLLPLHSLMPVTFLSCTHAQRVTLNGLDAQGGGGSVEEKHEGGAGWMISGQHWTT